MKKPKITKAALKVLKAYERGEYHNKRLIENFFTDTIRTFIEPGKCLKLTGFDYTHYMKALFPKMATEVCVIEKEPYIFYDIYQQASKCPHNSEGKVKLFQTDIGETFIDNCVYIDLDLMQKLDKMLSIIRFQIASQQLTVGGVKAISFTANIRHGGSASDRFYLLQEFLHEEFDADLLGFNGIAEGFGKTKDALEFPGVRKGRQGVHIHRYIPNFSDMGDIVNLQHIHYADSSHYMTTLIIYR